VNVYCIDTSSLIELKIKYPREVFPTLWEKMEELIQNGRIIAPIEVKKEIEKGDDELKKWVRGKKRNRMFIKPDENQVMKVKEILKDFPFLAKPDKPDEPNADPWLFAVVLVKIEEEKERLIQYNSIVTDESQRKPRKIPAVCKEIGIVSINLIGLFKEEGWKF
jgi:hypothetical protein